MELLRNPTRSVRIGSVHIGAGHPIAVQSMTATPTQDVDATVALVNRLAEAGADVVRIAVDSKKENWTAWANHMWPSVYLIDIGTALALLFLAANLALRNRRESGLVHISWPEQLRLALNVAAMLPLAVILAGAASRGTWEPKLIALTFGLALGAQITDRWLFYEKLNERVL